MDSVIKKIIDAENQAQNILDEMSEVRKKDFEDLQNLLQNRKCELISQAESKIQEVKAYELQLKQEREFEIERVYAQALETLKAKFNAGRKAWVMEIVGRVLKMD